MKTYVLYPAPDTKKESRFGYSVSCLTVATIASRFGETRYFDFSLEQDLARSESVMINELRQTSDKTTCIVFFDSVPLHRSSNVSSARILCEKLKNVLPSTRIIACGPYCMIRKRHEIVADITIVNEPEFSLERVLNNDIHAGCLMAQNDVAANIELVENLDSLPIPDRTLLPPGCETPLTSDGIQRLARSAVVTTTRGCFGSCKFCPRVAWNLSRVRHHSIDYVAAEIQNLIRQGYQNIWFDDENMGVDSEWSISLFDRIADINADRGCGLYLSAWGRVSEVFFEHAYRAGVRIVSFGVESGSDTVLRFLGKPVGVKSLADSISYADKHGLFTVANIIIGSPCETAEDLNRTCDFLKTVPVDQANIKVLSYIRGAPLWNNALKEGLIEETEDCVFADALRGLSNRTFDILIQEQDHLNRVFEDDPRRLFRLKAKISRYGTPYVLEAANAI